MTRRPALKSGWHRPIASKDFPNHVPGVPA